MLSYSLSPAENYKRDPKKWAEVPGPAARLMKAEFTCACHCSKHFSYKSFFSSQQSLLEGSCYYLPHLIGKETKAQRG